MGATSCWGGSSTEAKIENPSVTYDGVYEYDNGYAMRRYTIRGNRWNVIMRTGDDYDSYGGELISNGLFTKNGSIEGKVFESYIEVNPLKIKVRKIK